MRQKQVLIKADDYARNPGELDTWRRFIDCALNVGYVPSIGIIGQGLQAHGRETKSYLRMLVEVYGIEIWNHSYSHADFTTLTPDQVRTEIELGQQAIHDQVGISPQVFGPPFNRIDQASADAVVATKAFSSYFCLDGLVPPAQNIDRRYLSSLEQGTDIFRPIRLKAFQLEAKRRGDTDFFVLQVHPFYWTENCLKNFETVLRSLKGQGFQGVRAIDRTEYQSTRSNPLPPGQSLAANLIFEEEVLTEIADDTKATQSDSAYYYRMLRTGTSEISLFLRKMGFYDLAQKSTPVSIIDVGSGVGNWTTAASLIPNSSILSVDREQRHITYLQKRCSGSRIQVDVAEFDQLNITPGTYDGIICNNTLNYLDLVSALRRFGSILRIGGLAYVGIQNRLYPLRDAALAVEAGNLKAAQNSLLRLITNEGAKCGLTPGAPIRYWNSDELAAAGLGCGLKLQRRNVTPPGEYGELGNRGTFFGYLFAKTNAAQKISEQAVSDAARHLSFALIRAAGKQLDEIERLPGVPETVAQVARFRREAENADTNTISIDRQNPLKGLASLSESYAFFSTCKRIELSGDVEGKITFADPLYAALVTLYGALIAEDPAGSHAAIAEIKDVLKDCEDSSLAYWM